MRIESPARFLIKALEAIKMFFCYVFCPHPHFVASRALIKNRLDKSSNLAHRGMHAKFQLIWTIRLVRAMGGVGS